MENTFKLTIPPKGRIHHGEQFELCYIRHQYFRKSDFDLTEEIAQPYRGIISQLSNRTYGVYRPIFSSVGLEKEDLHSIGMIHLVSFLGLFSLEKLPDKYREFTEIFQNRNTSGPSEDDYLDKNKASFTAFLKQRMEDLVRVCRQKDRNIRGTIAETLNTYHGTKTPPKILRNLINHNEEYGYLKMDVSAFKTIRKKAKAGDSLVFQYENVWYVGIQLNYKNPTLVDFSGANLDPYDNIHNMSPEEIVFAQLENDKWNRRHIEFDLLDKKEKKSELTLFIENHKDNPRYKEEVRAAKKILRTQGATVE